MGAVEIAVAALILSVFIGLFNYFGFSVKTREMVATSKQEMKDVRKEIDEIKRSIEPLPKLAAQSEIFWRIVEKDLSKMLTRPTHKRIDELLKKMEERTLEGAEPEELIGRIRENLNFLDKTSQFLSYLVIARLEQLKGEVTQR